MPGQSYSALANKQAELIRKSLQGSVFLASIDAPKLPSAITDPTDKLHVALPVTGTPQIPWDDLGLLSGDGAQFSSDTTSSDVTSWGSFEPTRSDITAENLSLTVLAQETKLSTISLYTGVDLSGVTPATGSGEVSFARPGRPSSRAYQVYSLAVDEGDFGEIYIGRYLPRAKVTGKAEQQFGAGDDPIGWGVTFAGQQDSTLGFAERWFFGGPGWFGLLEKMGFPAPA